MSPKQKNLFEKGLRAYLRLKQLKKIQSVKIGIGGAGGLGSNLAVILVRCGFKNFEIIDKDRIEPSNLNRQFYFLNEIGKSKVKTLKKTLLQINPSLKVITHETAWSQKDGNLFFKDCSIIAEAFDQVDFKRDFIEFYADKAELLVSGNGLAGISSLKNFEVKRVGRIYIVGDRKTSVSKTHPPLAPGVTACASLMAQIILRASLTQKLSRFTL